ncbi:retinaldehyde-binding protein 1-like [Leptidea sinapis]|uniref:retinaldehyde-binding protein 1-like n=1 Tax=Leptidea sinapis TaxID=189913 RepID=UPI00212B6A83|nr:retinaldehyde-binding protein 1-like [Leptidea sinapis]
MDTIQKTIVLDFNNDTLQYLRKLYNLDTPKRMTEALDNLQSWIDKQSHFLKKDFSREYLERLIITSKGSIERAKKKLDKMCTLRSILPQYFGVFNPKEDLQYFSESIMNVLLPKLTDDHYRIYIFKPVVKSFKMPFLDFYKLFAMMCEYILATDYANGFIAILDYTDINLMEVIKNLNLVELQHILKIVTEGYGLRIKSLNIISTSKAVDTLMSLLKQVLSEKLIGRVHVFKDYSGLYGEVPQQILPSDCGGEEISIKELNDNLMEELCSDKFQKHLTEMMNAKTEESYRQTDQFNTEFLGTAGSFRTISVD